MKLKKYPRNISLDAVLLFILVILSLEILYKSPGISTGIIFWIIGFILLAVYLILDIKIKTQFIYLYKSIIIVFLISWLFLPFMFQDILMQYKIKQVLYTHDGAQQIEEGVKYLLQGKNPYAENYINTPLEHLWGGKIIDIHGEKIQNPAIYHFVYLPGYILFSLPFYLIGMSITGWYDQRIIYIILFFLTLFVIYKIPPKASDKILSLIILGFNPLLLYYFIGGTNDIFVFFWIILSIYLLHINKIKLSSLFFGLAVVSKHMAWFLIPFYFIFLWLKDEGLSFKEKLKNIFKKVYPFILIVILAVLPFLIWDFNSFIEDIYRYPAGMLTTSFPITGHAYASLLIFLKIIASDRDYYPFWIIQLIFCLPLLYFLIKMQIKNNSLSLVMFNHGLLLFIFWFFSRSFNEHYIGYLSLVFITAYFFDDQEKIDDNIC